MKNNDSVLKVDSSKNLLKFIKNVETENSAEISKMIRNDVEMFFDIEMTLKKLKRFCDDDGVYYAVDTVRCLILELHEKLLKLDHQNNQHKKLVDEIFSDTKLLYHIINENRDVVLYE